MVGYKTVEAGSLESLMSAVKQQPVSVAIEADQMSFQLYKRGVLTGSCGATLDHGVLLVGYGTSEDGKDYWKVKNSWDSSWGEAGYIRMQRGKRVDGGECGILQDASYPVTRAVGPSPSPAPSPSPTPECEDKEAFCKNPVVFNPESDCASLFEFCRKTCGCCGPDSCSTAKTFLIQKQARFLKAKARMHALQAF